ncbi:MAG: hypothetical protein JW395_0514 [Nitrospira sp.]|jgi:hypothetical protein|nr:hypothetical protein [Nitrospira sp.]
MSTPSVPSGQLLLYLANNVLKLYNETYREGVSAGALAAANNGTPLPPDATTQELLDYIGGTMQKYIPSDLRSIFIQQLLTFLQRHSVLTGSAPLSGSINPNGLGGAFLTIEGAEPGDFVDVSFSDGLGASPYQVTALVSALNTVTVGIWNPPGFFTLDLNGKTAYVRVTKRT